MKGGKPTLQQHGASQRPGRWNRWKSGPGTPSHWKADIENDDADIDMRGDKFDIGTPEDNEVAGEEVDQEQLQKVIGWLRSKGADATVIGTINEIKEASRPAEAPEATKDPWRALQSCKDRLRGVARQLADSEVNVDFLQQQFKESQDWHDDLIDKRDALQKEILQLQEIVGSSELKQRVETYEDVISQLREKLQNGVPESPKERKQLFNHVFNGNQGSSEDDEKAGDDSTDVFVDRQGFGFVGVGTAESGFGPTKFAKFGHSPYSREQSLGQGEGPGGETAAAPAPADASKA